MELELRDLLDHPREALDIELKTWLDLKDNVQRAKVARHLAALANHGGGKLLFGFRDDLTPDPNRPSSLNDYSRDQISSIVDRYLTPSFQCEVKLVSNTNGDTFPIALVPSHQDVPIASKRNGPNDRKGNPIGIKADTYYIRKPGPKSEVIIGAAEWEPLIRRCVLKRGDRLLRDVASLLQPTPQLSSNDVRRLTEWHNHSEKRFMQAIESFNDIDVSISFKDNYYQLSYLICGGDSNPIHVASLIDVVQEVHRDVRSSLQGGWSLFHVYFGPGLEPQFVPEQKDGSGVDLLEFVTLAEEAQGLVPPEFWRVTPDGRATILRCYLEDRKDVVNSSGRQAGSWISPETIIRDTTELVAHARSLARRLEGASSVYFKCKWVGLENRRLAQFDSPLPIRPGLAATVSTRITDGHWDTANLAGEWPAVVAELTAPVFRVFGFNNCDAQFVRQVAEKFTVGEN